MKTHEFKIINQYINNRQKNVALDIGANSGEFSKYYSDVFAFVHAFEPVLSTFDTLRENLKSYHNVHTYNVAIGDKKSEVDIVNLKGHSSRNKIQDVSGKKWLDHRIKSRNLDSDQWTIETVKQHSIDSYKIDYVDLIKIDTEGYVLPVLTGMTDTLCKYKPILYIELNKDTPHSKECFSMLDSMSYEKKYVDNLNYIFFSKHNPIYDIVNKPVAD